MLRIAEELVKPVIGRQHLVAVAEIILAKLAGDVTERFEQFSDLYHLNAEEEPENPDYPKNPEFKKKFGPRGGG